jgi:hypothetical protein
MTTSHLLLMTSLYSAAFVGVAYLTRAKAPRIAGALCGGAVCGVVALLAIALGETQGWWRVPKFGSLYFRLLLWLGVAVSCTPVYLITWRVARRFGGRGLAMFALAAAVIGPPRDYQVAAMFPDWIAFSPGIAPVLAVATFYALLVVVGHAVMRIVSGPAQGDSFSRPLEGDGKNSDACKLPQARVERQCPGTER